MDLSLIFSDIFERGIGSLFGRQSFNIRDRSGLLYEPPQMVLC
jgi:hypothetical protein